MGEERGAGSAAWTPRGGYPVASNRAASNRSGAASTLDLDPAEENRDTVASVAPAP